MAIKPGAVALLILALGVAVVQAAERDLAFEPAEWTLRFPATSRVPCPRPSSAVSLGAAGGRALCLYGSVWTDSAVPRGGELGTHLTPAILLGGYGPMAVGDLNGDGLEDLAGTNGCAAFVGPDPGATCPGRVLVDFAPFTIPDASGAVGDRPTGDWTLVSGNLTSFLGTRLALGDWNGDGNLDLVAGSKGNSLWGTETCVVGILGPLQAGVVDLMVQAPDFRTCSSDLAFGFGMALGDLDGDGRADLAMSSETGIRVFLGQRLTGDVNAASPDLLVRYPAGTVAGPSYVQDNIPIVIRDIGGDGFGDLVFGLPVSAGDVFVIRGSAVLPAIIDLAVTSADARITSSACCDRLGSTLAVADWDADGAMDIITGAPGASGPNGTRLECGAVHVVVGGPGLVGAVDVRVQSPMLTVHGPRARARLGQGYNGFGLVVADLSGDGVMDLAAEAPEDRASLFDSCSQGSTRAAVHVIHGVSPLRFDVLHAIDDPFVFNLETSGVTSPWDMAPSLASDGRLHFFRVDDSSRRPATIFVTRQIALDSVRLAWRDSASSRVAPDPGLSSVQSFAECVKPDGGSVARVVVTPRDAAGELLGAALDVLPMTPDAWLPLEPLGGFADLGDGRYGLQLVASSAGTAAIGVSAEGTSLAASPVVTSDDAAPDVAIQRSMGSAAPGVPISFTALLTTCAAPCSVEWDFDGDGRVDSTAVDDIHAYPQPGYYAVVLTARDSRGCVTQAATRLAIEE